MDAHVEDRYTITQANAPLGVELVDLQGGISSLSTLPLSPGDVYAARWDLAHSQALIAVRSPANANGPRTDYWLWLAFSGGFVNVAETLADALTGNPFLKVHVSCGLYDLATPWLASHYIPGKPMARCIPSHAPRRC